MAEAESSKRDKLKAESSRLKAERGLAEIVNDPQSEGDRRYIEAQRVRALVQTLGLLNDLRAGGPYNEYDRSVYAGKLRAERVDNLVDFIRRCLGEK